MSDAGKKGPIMESTTSTWTYTCIHDCRKEVQFDIERERKPPRDHDWEVNQAEQRLLSLGWVTERLTDNDGRPHIFAHCSVGCHNKKMREDKSQRRKDWWWTKCRKFYGTPPTCTCRLVEDTRGVLEPERDANCDWHNWEDKYQRAHDAYERELFEHWKDIPIGTIVVMRKDGRAGRVSAPPKILKWSFGHGSNCLVPVEGWAPHPHARDLELPVAGDWRWLPPLKGETPGDRKSKDAPD